MAKNLLTFNNDVNYNNKKWKSSQYNLSDVVLSLTDKNPYGAGLKLYTLFNYDAFLNVVQYYNCDFDSIKKILGINGEYVERKGDLYSPTFDPKRNANVLTLPQKEMEIRAEKIYKDLIQELNEISKIIDKKV